MSEESRWSNSPKSRGDVRRFKVEALARNKNKALILLASCLIVVHGLSYAYGINSSLFWSWIVVWPATLVAYLLTVLCLLIGVRALIKKQSVFRFGLVWILLTSVVMLVPGYYSEFAGALSSFQLAGPKEVFAEARALIMKCQELPQNCGHVQDIPPAIQRIHPADVDVYDNFVVLGKLGFFHPDGFVIFSQGSVPSEGMRVREIREELYWTYGN